MMSFDMPLENGIVVAETHLPIMNNIVIDCVDFLFIFVNVEVFAVGLHEDGIFLEGFLDERSFLLPMVFVLFESLEVTGLFGILNLLLSVQTIQHCVPVDSCIKSIF